MSYKLPWGHLSPSQLNMWERCQVQYRIFQVDGAKAPPDCGLEVKIQTHDTILRGDLEQKIKSGENLPNSHLQEHFIAGLETRVDAMKADPNRSEPIEKIVQTEATYFGKIASMSQPWRKATRPRAIEREILFTIGDVPVKCRLDLLVDEGVNDRVQDLKRSGRKLPKGSAQGSRQLATYAIGMQSADVGLVNIVENVLPVVEIQDAQISQGLAERTKAQYEGIAEQITFATEKDRFVPVDTTDQRKAWCCTAQYCGAWRIGSKDWKTGRDISCEYGERAVSKVFGA